MNAVVRRHVVRLAVVLAAGLFGALPFAAAGAGQEKDAEKPLATAKHESGLIVEVLEVKADSNEFLTIRWRYRNSTDKTIELFAATPPAPYAPNAPKNIPLRFYPSVYYVEGKFESAKAFKHYIAIEEGTNKRYAKDLGRAAVKLRPNEQFEIWAKFSQPASATTISLVLPNTPVIENLMPNSRRER